MEVLGEGTKLELMLLHPLNEPQGSLNQPTLVAVLMRVLQVVTGSEALRHISSKTCKDPTLYRDADESAGGDYRGLSPCCCLYKEPQGLLSQATTPHTEENATSDDRDGDSAAVSHKAVPRAQSPSASQLLQHGLTTAS